ncbi:SigE family RNA polymerase sigma factor [Yinghuangia seranimata]|uniref:SigE family RNA polymerase sigma factor n=1 Tax=Yinghuangia seranimata TaxID=408067 RepID=UPI00248BDB02|nr:SigE family RNA polymerase sigma factor [Yinghuangia seranimata]MDI2132038.1 SigE family RNA polymerase sigma factor [Yinghuangia seranimata]
MRPDEVAQFHEFVQARWARLVRIAYLLTGDHAEAEDLAQTALIKVYAAWRRVQSSDSPDAYVRRILVNANAGRFRKKRVTQVLGMGIPDVQVADSTRTVDQRDALLRALARLPARQRAVVVLRYWEDLPETEVARTLGCSVGTVKSQASKGLAKLREDPGLTGPVWDSAHPSEVQVRA